MNPISVLLSFLVAQTTLGNGDLRTLHLAIWSCSRAVRWKSNGGFCTIVVDNHKIYKSTIQMNNFWQSSQKVEGYGGCIAWFAQQTVQQCIWENRGCSGWLMQPQRHPNLYLWWHSMAYWDVQGVSIVCLEWACSPEKLTIVFAISRLRIFGREALMKSYIIPFSRKFQYQSDNPLMSCVGEESIPSLSHGKYHHLCQFEISMQYTIFLNKTSIFLQTHIMRSLIIWIISNRKSMIWHDVKNISFRDWILKPCQRPWWNSDLRLFFGSYFCCSCIYFHSL